MGASYRDMQEGKNPIFGVNILNLKGSLWKGTKRGKKLIPLLMFKRWICCWKLSPKSVQVTSTSTPLNEQLLFASTFLVALFFLKFHVSSSSVKNSWYYCCCLLFLAEPTWGREWWMWERDRERDSSEIIGVLVWELVKLGLLIKLDKTLI